MADIFADLMADVDTSAIKPLSEATAMQAAQEKPEVTTDDKSDDQSTPAGGDTAPASVEESSSQYGVESTSEAPNPFASALASASQESGASPTPSSAIFEESDTAATAAEAEAAGSGSGSSSADATESATNTTETPIAGVDTPEPSSDPLTSAVSSSVISSSISSSESNSEPPEPSEATLSSAPESSATVGDDAPSSSAVEPSETDEAEKSEDESEDEDSSSSSSEEDEEEEEDDQAEQTTTEDTPQPSTISSSASVSAAAPIPTVDVSKYTREVERLKLELQRAQKALEDLKTTKDQQIIQLKMKFKDISNQQKSVFMKMQEKRKEAISKAQKYRASSQSAQEEVASLKTKLDSEVQRRNAVEAECKRLGESKTAAEKAYTSTISDLKSALERSEMTRESATSEMAAATSALDKLLALEELKNQMRCHIEHSKKGVFNQTVLKLILPFFEGDIGETFNIAWFRLHNSEIIPIPMSEDLEEYRLTADDVGSMIQVSVTSKLMPECMESAKVGPVLLNKSVESTVDSYMIRVVKNQVEFEVTPCLSDGPTTACLAKYLTATEKSLVLLLNREKVKLRGSKKKTIDKQNYQTGMRVKCFAKECLFSFRMKESDTPVVLAAKNDFERDVFAVLLRVYITKLKVTSQPAIVHYQHLVFSNRAANEEDLNGAVGEKMVYDSKKLLSKMLEPYQHTRRGSGSRSSALGGVGMTIMGTTPSSSKPALSDLPELSVSAATNLSNRELSSTMQDFPTLDFDDPLDEKQDTPATPQSGSASAAIASKSHGRRGRAAATSGASISAMGSPLTGSTPASPRRRAPAPPGQMRSPEMILQSQVSEERGPPAKFPDDPPRATSISSAMSLDRATTADSVVSLDRPVSEPKATAMVPPSPRSTAATDDESESTAAAADSSRIFKGIEFVDASEVKTATDEDLAKVTLGGGLGMPAPSGGGKKKKAAAARRKVGKSSEEASKEAKKLKKRGKKSKKNTVCITESMNLTMKDGKAIAAAVKGSLSIALTEAVSERSFKLSGFIGGMKVRFSEGIATPSAPESTNGEVKLTISKTKSFVELLQYDYPVSVADLKANKIPILVEYEKKLTEDLYDLTCDIRFVKSMVGKRAFISKLEFNGRCQPESSVISECRTPSLPSFLSFEDKSNHVSWVGEMLPDEVKRGGIKLNCQGSVSKGFTGLKMTSSVDFGGVCSLPIELVPSEPIQVGDKSVASLKHLKEMTCKIDII